MKGKKLFKIMLEGFLVIGILAVALIFYMHSDVHRTRAIKAFFKQKYNVTVDDGGDVVLSGDEFTITTEDKIFVWGTCGFFGNVETDSYINFYYADDCVDHIRHVIGDCFADSMIIYDGIRLSELASIPLETKAIHSYDEYVTPTKKAWENAEVHKYYYKISIRVYVRESEDVGNVGEAMAKLQDGKEYFDVFFYAVPDKLFDHHKEKETYAYFRGKALGELEDDLDKETAIELEKLIYHRSGLVDEYCPWDRKAMPENDDIERESLGRIVRKIEGEKEHELRRYCFHKHV